MATDELDRRSVLKLSCGVTAAMATGSLAGCSSIPFFGSDERGPPYRRWAFDPAELGSDNYETSFVDVAAVLDHQSDLDEKYVDTIKSSVESQFDGAGISAETANYLVDLGGISHVLKANHDRGRVVDALKDAGYETREKVSGYRILVPSEKESEVARATDGTHLLSTVALTEGKPTETAKMMIETSNGNNDRYADVNEDFPAAYGPIDGFHVQNVTTTHRGDGRFEALVAAAEGTRIEGETSRIRYVYVFDDADSLSDADLEKSKEKLKEAELENVTLERDGRVGTISGDLDTGSLPF